MDEKSIVEKVILVFADKKKHSVRFDNKKSDVVKSIYLINAAFVRLEEPKKITLIIRQTD